MAHPTIQNFTRVEFSRFKSFKSFRLDLRHFNVIVGPNNSGKSTVLAAFRILSAAIRKANARQAIPLRGPNGMTHGHNVELTSTSVAEENIFYNYNTSEPAKITFHLSNNNSLTLWFPEPQECFLLMDAQGNPTHTPTAFRKQFNSPIGFVPILGPVEHNEQLYDKEAARLALFNYRAARNFRNIWHHYPDKFDEFRNLLQQTWPGMDIEPPEIDRSHPKPLLRMYCPEERIPREIFWAGFGFQVWCQMLTHVIQSKDVSLFLIDEPDIYLHSELQRQLLMLLRNLGPDILIATHSTEMITEAEPDDIVLVNKARKSARRLSDPSQLEQVFDALGSNTNPILTQLAKTRRVLFLEGRDFQILGRFARKLGALSVGNRRDFAVVPVGGFSPERIRALKAGMELTLGVTIASAAILDRDFRCDEECAAIADDCRRFCNFVHILKRKEIENFLLSPPAIDRAMAARILDRNKRSGTSLAYENCANELLEQFCRERRSYTTSQFLTERRRFYRSATPSLAEAQINEAGLDAFNNTWDDPCRRLSLVPGKDALSELNTSMQERYGTNVTATAIIDAMHVSDVPDEMVEVIEMLKGFATTLRTTDALPH